MNEQRSFGQTTNLLESGLGPRQEGGVGQVEGVAGVLEGLPAVSGLLHALLREVGIKPEDERADDKG